MSIPTSYLTSAKNLGKILEAIQNAKAPERFTQNFLEGLGFKSSSDRLVIGVLKSLRFLDDQGKPLDPYFTFLDKTVSKGVLAEQIEEAYSDLFQVNKNANKLARSDIENKLKTLSQGQYSESVITKMAMTFAQLCKLADFTTVSARSQAPAANQSEEVEATSGSKSDEEMHMVNTATDSAAADKTRSDRLRFTGGLHYNIQLILPESRDPKVYDALFRSLKEHLG